MPPNPTGIPNVRPALPKISDLPMVSGHKIIGGSKAMPGAQGGGIEQFYRIVKVHGGTLIPGFVADLPDDLCGASPNTTGLMGAEKCVLVKAANPCN